MPNHSKEPKLKQPMFSVLSRKVKLLFYVIQSVHFLILHIFRNQQNANYITMKQITKCHIRCQPYMFQHQGAIIREFVNNTGLYRESVNNTGL